MPQGIRRDKMNDVVLKVLGAAMPRVDCVGSVVLLEVDGLTTLEVDGLTTFEVDERIALGVIA